MDWKAWTPALVAELALDRKPVAVGFLGALPPGAPPPEGKVSVCQALQRSSEGHAVTLTAETCGCPGGLVNLGLGRTPAEGKERLITFLVDKERAFASRAALHRGQSVLEPPLGLASHVCFAPLDQAGFQPDLVLFLGRPGSLQRLIGLVNFWEGGRLATDLSGPTCRAGITAPLLTGDLGLSLLDFGARRLAVFPEELLLVSVPFHRMLGVLAALEGPARRENLGREEAVRDIEALGPVERPGV
jgi:uncharacterized protein (DUF169 family)